MHELSELNRDEENANERSPLQAEQNVDDDKKTVKKLNGRDLEQSDSKSRKSFFLKSLFKVICIILLVLLLIIVILISIILGLKTFSSSPENMFYLVPTQAFSDVLKFSRDLNSSWYPLTDQMQSFINERKNALATAQLLQTPYCSSNSRTKNEPCIYDIQQVITGCNETDNFGYPTNSPCFFLVFNNQMALQPDNNSQLNDGKNKLSHLIESYQNGSVYFHLNCNGSRAWDSENFDGVNYYPFQSLNKTFFPLDVKNVYQIPFLALKFINIKPYKLVSINCEVWSINVLSKLIKPEDVPFEVFNFVFSLES